MKKRFPELIIWISLFGLILFLSITRKITDSEFWAMTQAKELGNFATFQITMYAKFMFYLLLKIPHLFPISSVAHIEFVRTIFALLATGSLALVYLICRRLNWSKVHSYGIVLFLFLSGYFNTQMYAVRADIVASGMTLICLCYALSVKNIRNFRSQIILAGLAFATFLCTPKSIYLILSLSVFLFFYWREAYPKAAHRLIRIFMCLLFPICLLWFVGGLLVQPIGESYAQALLYYRSASIVTSHWEEVGWRYVVRIFYRDPLHFLLVVSALTYGLVKFRSLTDREKGILAMGVMAIASMTIHNQKVPFFIASLMPFVYLSLGPLFSRFSGKQVALILVLFSFIDIALFAPRNIWGPKSDKQKEIMNFLEVDLMGPHPDWTYFDGIGILPRRDNLLLYIGPNDKFTNDYSLETVRKRKPEVILYSARMFMLEPHITVFLMQNYKMLGNGIYISNAVPPEQYKDVHYTIDRDVQTEFDYWSP